MRTYCPMSMIQSYCHHLVKMEIGLVLVLEDTNDLGVDMPTILESPYGTREAHKLILVAIGGQNVRF